MTDAAVMRFAILRTSAADGHEKSTDRQLRVRCLISDHAVFVTRTLRGHGVPARDLDDEVQRTFITAARRIDDIRPGTERGFLFAVAKKLAARALRAQARRREVLNAEGPEPMEARATPEHIADQKQAFEAFERILDSIAAPLRSVLALHAFEGLKVREMAAVLGIPTGTVVSRLRRARAELRVKLARVASAARDQRGLPRAGTKEPELARSTAVRSHG
jgi:RNA polymerase sigma-70 factor (ECF subfamily)